MRSSNLLLPLALILSIQIGLVYTDSSSFIGTWTNPKIRNDDNSFCCIPTTLKIEDGGFGRLIATYNYTGDYRSKCYTLFDNSKGGVISLSQTTNYPNQYYGKFPDTAITFYYEVSNTTGLNIISTSTYLYHKEPCDFAMTSKNGKFSLGMISNHSSSYQLSPYCSLRPHFHPSCRHFYIQ